MSLPATATHRLLADGPALCQVISAIHQRGWCDGTGGNFSSVLCREPLALLMAPSGVDKGLLQPADLIVVDGDGQVIGGDGKASAETRLHLTIIANTNAGAVLHTHSQAATLLSQLPPPNGFCEALWPETVKVNGSSTAFAPSSFSQHTAGPGASTRVSPGTPTQSPRDAHVVPGLRYREPESALCASDPTNSVPGSTKSSDGSTRCVSEVAQPYEAQRPPVHDPGPAIDQGESSSHSTLQHSEPQNLVSESEGLSPRLFHGHLRLSDLEMLKGLEGIESHTTTIAIPILANSQDMRQLSQAAHPHLAMAPHALLIAGHGLYVWGDSLNQARRHLEILEFLLEQAWRRCLLNALQSKQPTAQ